MVERERREGGAGVVERVRGGGPGLVERWDEGRGNKGGREGGWGAGVVERGEE